MAEFFQVYIGFLVVAIFAKTECYSPSNLLVRSAMCRTSATYQLSTCRKWYVHHSKHSMIILVTKPISITPVLSLARKASEKILPVKTITQGKSKLLVENIFSYQSSYWGMSTLAVPVLLINKMIFKAESIRLQGGIEIYAWVKDLPTFIRGRLELMTLRKDLINLARRLGISRRWEFNKTDLIDKIMTWEPKNVGPDERKEKRAAELRAMTLRGPLVKVAEGLGIKNQWIMNEEDLKGTILAKEEGKEIKEEGQPIFDNWANEAAIQRETEAAEITKKELESLLDCKGEDWRDKLWEATERAYAKGRSKQFRKEVARFKEDAENFNRLKVCCRE